MKRCPKCHSEQITVRWHSTLWDCEPRSHVREKNLAEGEHMHYFCGVCRYEEAGPAKDSPDYVEEPKQLEENVGSNDANHIRSTE